MTQEQANTGNGKPMTQKRTPSPRWWARAPVGVIVFLIIAALIVSLIRYFGKIESGLVDSLLLGFLVFLIGGAVGAGEIIDRYRDDPFLALRKQPSVLYVAVNALAATTAFVLIQVYDKDFESLSVPTQVLLAGFGTMALFRSSVFNATVGDKQVGVGPDAFLTTILGAADSRVDRELACKRAVDVERIMSKVTDAERARAVLPLYCYRLLQSSLSENDYTALMKKIEDVYESDPENPHDLPTDRTKIFVLGLLLMNYMGKEVLKAAVDTLQSDLDKKPGLDGKEEAEPTPDRGPSAGEPETAPAL